MQSPRNRQGCSALARLILDQPVGLTVWAHLRGDQRLYTLLCKVSNKTSATRATSYGDGSRYSTKGKVKIRTYGQHLRLRIIWYAPATGSYVAYTKTKTYKRDRMECPDLTDRASGAISARVFPIASRLNSRS